MPATLKHHLHALPPEQIVRVAGDLEVPIRAPFVEDSRAVQPGGVFVARRGQTHDGHQFIDQAIEQGAAAIIGEQAIDLNVPYVQVSKAHQATGRLAASYYDFPSRKLTIFGVTGTNGKTTTTHLLHSILKAATKGKAGFISTIAADLGTSSADTGLHVTTPSAQDVQHYLAKMVEGGITHAVLEMTSHGLQQGRLSGVDIDVAILTNITHEHLDFHGSWEAYRNAKAIMFRMLKESYQKPGVAKVSVINYDDPSYEVFAALPADQVISYSLADKKATYRAKSIDHNPGMTQIQVDHLTLETKLVGEFNVYNILAALAAARAAGINGRAIRKGIRLVEAISGRMERIDEGQPFTAIVDFAHTPDALEKALNAGRALLEPGKRLIAVFGSAGLRDVEKRFMMAETSAKLADMTVLTAEDPRTEPLESILNMMAEGCMTQGGIEGETFIRVADRGAAIAAACEMAEPGDLVMVCGKGHEQSMCFGEIEYPWDDRDALRAALRGEPLETLPTAQKEA